MWSEKVNSRIDTSWPENYYVREGWIPLVEELVEKLIKIEPTFKIAQIKQKFGGLRFYANVTTTEAWDLIQEYEDKSFKVCEDCGAPAKLRGGVYLETLCDNCNPYGE